MNNNILWLKDPFILLKNPFDFFPISIMSKEEKCNAIVRFLIYYILVICALKLDIKWIKLSIIAVLLVTMYTIYDKPIPDKNNKIYLNKDLDYCRGSSIHNPMANPLITDNDIHKKACVESEETIKKNLRYNVYEDVNNPSISNLLHRTFYTTPVSNYPNDVNDFANFAYGQDETTTCKLGATGCEPFRDERYTSFNYEK